MRIGIFSAVVIAFIGAIMLFSHITRLQAVGEEDSPLYTFTQTARIFDGEDWNEVPWDDDLEAYNYYSAEVPDIVEFKLAFIINERTPTGYIIIENSLPEGMEYISGSLNINRDGISFYERQPLTSANRDLELVVLPTTGGLGYYEPGDNAIITFQAKFLFNNFEPCESFSNMVTVSVGFGEEENMSKNTIFSSPCAGLTLPDFEPTPTPTPNPLPDENKPVITTPPKVDFGPLMWIAVIGFATYIITGLATAIVIFIRSRH